MEVRFEKPLNLLYTNSQLFETFRVLEIIMESEQIEVIKI